MNTKRLWKIFVVIFSFVAFTGLGFAFNQIQHVCRMHTPAWSPDGKLVAAKSFLHNSWEQIVAIDSNEEHVIGEGYLPVWSPDGTLVAYLHNTDNNYTSLAIVKPDRTYEQTLVILKTITWIVWDDNEHITILTTPLTDEALTWVTISLIDKKGTLTGVRSFAGQRYFDGKSVFEDWGGNAWQVFVRSGKAVQITHDPVDKIDAAWSADGKRIAFATILQDGRGDIFVIDADGSNLKQLTHCTS